MRYSASATALRSSQAALAPLSIGPNAQTENPRDRRPLLRGQMASQLRNEHQAPPDHRFMNNVINTILETNGRFGYVIYSHIFEFLLPHAHFPYHAMATREVLTRPVAEATIFFRPTQVFQRAPLIPAYRAAPPIVSPSVVEDTSPAPNLKKSLRELRRLAVTSDWGNKTPISLAHQILSDDLRQRNLELSQPGSSSYASKRQSRQAVYTSLIAALCTSSQTRALSDISSLLSRQVSEGIPLSTRTLTAVLKMALESGDTTAALPIIRNILPSLPEAMDLHLLSLVVSTLIKSAKISPGEVEKLLGECLASQGVRSFEQWPVGMYDLVMQSHRGDFRGGVDYLGRLRPILLRRRLEDGWTEADSEAMVRPYITLMDIWIGSQVKGMPRFSEIPSRLAGGLEQLLDDSASLPTEFINAWMNAERITGNHVSVLDIWTKHFTKPGLASPPKEILEPDPKSYVTLWKTLKASRKPLSRPLVGDFISRPSCITTASLNAALSAAFATSTPDRALIYLLLGSFKGEAPPDWRTIDITAAGLVRIWRNTSSKIFKLEPENISVGARGHIRAHRARISNVKKSASAGPVTLREWDLISAQIFKLRTDKGAQMVLLPLGRPLARLEGSSDPAESGSVTSKFTSSRAVRLPIGPSATVDGGAETHVTISSPAPGLSRHEGRSLLSALKRLLEKSIIERYRHDSTWDSSDHRRSFRKLLEETREDVFK